ncbi:hypothetical protein [Desulfosoma caldarium]|uniref:Uncharacterized protein n=1 Tax=Desulfosoma caldarium TaxID=610254 RepID=A0A3N1UHF2_9BACT|nr:hypothetical protein [Desulfosoma caldarium]ROQ90695.1 hypothetical protein EDC27_2583 [Desulfosoma caldarium]
MRFLSFYLLSLLFIPSISIAQVQVLGFEIGSSTLEQVKTQLAKQTRIHDAGINKFTRGPQIKTDGEGYGIERLYEVFYIFDQDHKLAGVLMTMCKTRFDEILSFLSEKYTLTAKRRPFVGDMFARFKAKGVIIELDAPHLSFNMEIRYIRDDLYKQFNMQTAQETQQKKAYEKSKF